jgi:O-antigen/teichoic acid export membrane protein
VTPLGRIARLGAAFLGSNLARAAIGFGLSFALARGLGAERFGRWILCTAWASTLTVVVDLGFGVLLTRDGARQETEPGRLLLAALAVRLAVAVPLAALMYAGAGLVSSDAETIAGMRIAALLGTAGAVYGCFGALFRSQPRWLPAVLGLETGWLAVQLGGALLMVRVGGSSGLIASLMTLAVVVQLAQIATAAVCWRRVFGDRGTLHVPQRDVLVPLLRRALPFAASGVVANVQTRIGPLMLGYLSTPSALGLFGAASRFGSVARLVPQAVFAGALPVLSQEHGRDRAAAERVFQTFDRVLLAGSAALAAGCALCAAPVLRIVYGPSFTGAGPALVWISIGLIPLLSNSGRKVFLFASGGEAEVLRWSAVGLVVQAAVGAMTIPMFGSVGAAAGIAAGEAMIWWPLRRSTKTAAARSAGLQSSPTLRRTAEGLAEAGQACLHGQP